MDVSHKIIGTNLVILTHLNLNSCSKGNFKLCLNISFCFCRNLFALFLQNQLGITSNSEHPHDLFHFTS